MLRTISLKYILIIGSLFSICVISGCNEDDNPTCSDGIQNGNETGIDCGPIPCAPCATCSDGIMNGSETGVDCGGNCDVCSECDDGIQNGDETGVDCGGACDPCPDCMDGIQNGDETGVDCGGDCDPCPTCDDGIQNGTETGIDCGGECEPCPTCDDGIQNGNETGIDCGGDCDPCFECGTSIITDADGNTYETVLIGSQCWIKENLNTVVGNSICYDLNSVNCEIYGRLYNWFDAMEACPDGWHLPSKSEVDELAYFLDPINGWMPGNNAGGHMKQTGSSLWEAPNVGATNLSGFTGLPGGRGWYQSGDGNQLSTAGHFWASSLSEDENGANRGWRYTLASGDAQLYMLDTYSTQYALSCRCLKD